MNTEDIRKYAAEQGISQEEFPAASPTKRLLAGILSSPTSSIQKNNKNWESAPSPQKSNRPLCKKLFSNARPISAAG